MMRSMFSGVSGLRAHQVKMDIIGNNIANVNTVGFKSSSVSFAEVFSQTVKGAGSPQEGRGGTNPQQIGLGTGVAAIQVNHGKGSSQRTDNATDLMIDGNGFFMVSSDANAQNIFYTRAGNFSVDKDGYMVTPEGFKLLDKDLQPIQINKSETKAATATSGFVLNGNLNFNTDTEYSTTTDLFDSVGDKHTITVKFGANLLKSTAAIPAVANDPMYNATSNPNVKYSYREISVSDGTTTYPAAADPKLYAMFNEKGDVVDIVSLATAGDPNSAATPVAGTLTVAVSGAADITVPVNRTIFFKDNDVTSDRLFTQYSQATDLAAQVVDGNSAGSINSFNISSTGEVIATFTNGERSTDPKIIGLAIFDNPAGMMKVGNNLFTDTVNSGTPKIGGPGSGSFGSLTPGALEMSNVDLAAEFTDMITTQRGFQANSRIITTSDEILQELVNLKR